MTVAHSILVLLGHELPWLIWIKGLLLRSELSLILLLLHRLEVLLLLRVERTSHVVHLILLHLRSHLVRHGQLRLLLEALVAATELLLHILPVLLRLTRHELPLLPLRLLTVLLLVLIVGHEGALVVCVPHGLLLLHGSCRLRAATWHEWLRARRHLVALLLLRCGRLARRSLRGWREAFGNERLDLFHVLE